MQNQKFFCVMKVRATQALARRAERAMAPLYFHTRCLESLNKPSNCGTISTITHSLSFFLWCVGLCLERSCGATHKTVNFMNSLKFVFCEKIIDDSNFVSNRLLMLPSTRAATLSVEDFEGRSKAN